jgi:hypothetical protein
MLYAGIIFIATSICGARPVFYWNVAMCFIMGVGVGDMLPNTYALLAVMFFGIETCQRRLEEITADELKSAQPV